MSSWCRRCHRQSSKEWLAAHPEERRAKERRKYVARQRRLKGAEWNSLVRSPKADISSLTADQRRQRRNDQSRASKRRNAHKHVEVTRKRRAAKQARRRARERNSTGSFTAAQIDGLFKLQRGLCAICWIKLGKSFHRDHIDPLARGGGNDILNIQLLCPPCNTRKNAADPIEHMQRMGLLL